LNAEVPAEANKAYKETREYDPLREQIKYLQADPKETETYEFPDKEFKVAIIRILSVDYERAQTTKQNQGYDTWTK
jgi:hypothetical protein